MTVQGNPSGLSASIEAIFGSYRSERFVMPDLAKNAAGSLRPALSMFNAMMLTLSLPSLACSRLSDGISEPHALPDTSRVRVVSLEANFKTEFVGLLDKGVSALPDTMRALDVSLGGRAS